LKRPVFLAFGGVAFAIGVGLLAFGVYAAFFQDDGPPTSNAPIIREFTASPTPAPSTESPTPTPLPPLGDEPYRMVIDKIGVDAPVQEFGLDDNQVPEVPTGPGQGPGQIVAWYDFSAKPGVGSNAVFAGHVTWNGEAVFWDLPSVAMGDSIKLVGDDGTTLDYTVSQIFRVLPSDPASRDVMFNTNTNIITIITCDGVFTADNTEIGGEYDKRLVIRADLVSVTPPTNANGAG
jgi:LPXTG-site transpeptidase (sortase) family protein